jgi:photosystem II stability/assembly factor-like uncharacterized protein
VTIPVAARALRYGAEPAHVAFGANASADRVARPCGRYAGNVSCFYWHFEGLAGPPSVSLESAETVAVARRGRIVAAFISGDLALSDDRGATFRVVHLDGPQRPLSVAFDADSDFGVAVGTGGAVWTTDDRGDTWRLRRDGPVSLVDVAVVGRTAAWITEQNGVVVSVDGGVSVRSLSEGGPGVGRASLAIEPHEIRLRLGDGSVWRADASGNVERAGTTLHGGDPGGTR